MPWRSNPLEILKKLALIAALAWPSMGASVSFSPQGAEALKTVAGRKIPGVGLTEVVLCSSTTEVVSNGRVYQAAVRNGLSPLSPALASATLGRIAATNFWSLALDGITDLGGLTAALGAAHVIQMTDQMVTGLAMARPAVDIAKIRVRARIPNPAPFEGMLLDPTKSSVFTGPGCLDLLMVTKYVPGAKDLLGPFPVE